MSVVEREILGQRSWVLTNDNIEMAVTQLGAHMAPVEFCRDSVTVQPYYVSPWQGEGLELPEGISEVAQRGDFFCMPFGLDRAASSEEVHRPHGETSSSMWTYDSESKVGRVQTLTIQQRTTARVGSVERCFSLVEGDNVIYDDTQIMGFAGPVTFAHHAMLRAPKHNHPLLISTSSIAMGLVLPYAFADPSVGEYQALLPGGKFDDLRQVPSLRTPGSFEDCSIWPARPGFTDLLQLGSLPYGTEPAWTAAVNAAEGYVWFALKDRTVLPSSVMWMENCGRHRRPWNARTCVLGLEDACTYFDRGIADSTAPNLLSQCGVKTHHTLDGKGFSIRYIQGVAQAPCGFGRVAEIDFQRDGIVLSDEHGGQVFASVTIDFLRGASLL
jgi:hypothetical protein